MRILFVGTRRGGGGAETHLVELAVALGRIGHDVGAVVRPGGQIEAALREWPNIQTYHAEFRYASDLRGTRALRIASRAFKPDWMVASMPNEYYSVAAVGRLVNARVAFFEHTDQNKRPLTNFALPRIAHRFIVPSSYLRRHLIERGMPGDRVHVLHNPVDVDTLHPDGAAREAVREELGFKRDDVVVGFVGRIEEPKGCHVLARALDNTPKVRGLWVGDGPLRPSIENPRDVFTGWVNDASRYYHAMDVLALPTIKAETFGRVCIEAQATGVPVLASNLGGIPETLAAGETGWLLPPGDVEAWTDALHRVTDCKTRESLAANTTAFVAQRFSSRGIARDFVSLLQRG